MGKQRLTAKRSFLRTKKTQSADFSAQKSQKKANSPHGHRIFKGEYGDTVFYRRAMNYRGILERMPTDFWQRVTRLAGDLREATLRQRAAGLSGSGWTTSQMQGRVAEAIHGHPVSNDYFSTELTSSGLTFADTFLEAIGDPDFPESAKARARFLGESIAGYGEVSARRCRDICWEMRRREKQGKRSKPELWIKCCGKPRWTVNSVCPICGAYPIQIPPASFL